MKAITLIVLLMSLSLMGCATQPQGYWLGPNMTNQQAQSLEYDCKVTARNMYPGSGIGPELSREQEFSACMRARGFQWVRN